MLFDEGLGDFFQRIMIPDFPFHESLLIDDFVDAGVFTIRDEFDRFQF